MVSPGPSASEAVPFGLRGWSPVPRTQPEEEHEGAAGACQQTTGRGARGGQATPQGEQSPWLAWRVGVLMHGGAQLVLGSGSSSRGCTRGASRASRKGSEVLG